MNDMVPITARLDATISALVAAGAAARGMTGEEYVAAAIQQVAESDADYRAFIQVGIDAADQGDVFSQVAMEQWFEERIAARRQA